MNERNKKRLPSLSIFFPAFNDAGTIASMVLTAQIAARTITNEYEIIVVDDGSRDHTALELEELASKIPALRVIRHPKNLGYGAAIRSGLSAASKEWIFYTDGDGQYDPMEMSELVEALHEGVDIVNGYKVSRKDPLIRILLGSIYNIGVKLAFGLHIKDVDCDFRLMRRSIFSSIELESVTGSICVEMIKKIQDAGFGFEEVPVSHYYRQYGISQFYNFARLIRTARQLLILWWNLVLRRGYIAEKKLKKGLPKGSM
jgi:glycosyltransferase involved in cell wall biosynthesis